MLLEFPPNLIFQASKLQIPKCPHLNVDYDPISNLYSDSFHPDTIKCVSLEIFVLCFVILVPICWLMLCLRYSRQKEVDIASAFTIFAPQNKRVKALQTTFSHCHIVISCHISSIEADVGLRVSECSTAILCSYAELQRLSLASQ